MANGQRRSTVDMSEVLKGLDKLVAGKESIARTMGVAMGVEVRDEAKIRAPVLKPDNVGLDNQQPYVLRNAIYVAYDKRGRVLNASSYKYTVSWNSLKAPHGHLAEFGHNMPFLYAQTLDGRYFTPMPGQPNKDGFFVAAQPFLGPAFDAKVSGLQNIAAAAGAARLKELMA